ncbi:CLUMA_CG005217, isoform A [Clunio marinus]|uniref:CLUMA_CG005217, isoform A n=1 Tax=Clunio marinus TaxID=568069 RepID=A0A1J1HVI1_9DIPT|nr:CLUMA_CG005217, isoform A [Clunio marinus]
MGRKKKSLLEVSDKTFKQRIAKLKIGKKKLLNLMPTTYTMPSTSYKQIEFVSDSIDTLQASTQTASMASDTNKTVGLNISEINKKLQIIKDDLKTIKESQQTILFKFNDLKKEFKNLSSALRSHDSSLLLPETEDTSFVPEPINSMERLNDLERRLINYNKNPSLDNDFVILRNKLINYYSKKIYNQDARTNPKNGLASSLMKIYFSEDFRKNIGWTDHKDRIPFKKYCGHIMLVRDIVNKKAVGTYSGYEEAAKAVYNFQRRYHESANAFKRMRKTEHDQRSYDDSLINFL